MISQQNHEMELATIDSSGEEEWNCPTCGRRISITWQPWKKIILEPGDIFAAHSGSKGILNIGLLAINLGGEDSSSATTQSSVHDPYLAPWVRWLDKMDLDDF